MAAASTIMSERDSMTNMPAATRKLVSEAEELHKSIYTVDEATTETSEPVQEPVQEPVHQEPEPEPVEDWQAKYLALEQRHKTLKGKYDAEVPRYQAEIRELRNAQPPPPPEPEPDEPPPRYLKDEDIDDYGEDLISVIKRAAKEEFTPLISRLERENEQLRSQMGGVTSNIQQTTRQRLLDGMDRSMPGWREINQSTEFVDWLSGIDPFSGQRRHDLLLQAFEANDEARTLAFFKSYQNENAAVTQGATSQSQSADRKPKLNLDTLVAPGSPKSAGAPRAQEGSERIWSQREIARFYDEVTAGKYRSRPKDKARIEAEIIKAANTGRVR